MNAQRGMFRLWVVVSALFVIGVGAASYGGIRNEFKVANTDYDALAKEAGGTTLLPVDCAKARGTISDYSLKDGLCWYTTENFRRLYPEYQNLSNRALSDRIYTKADIPLRKAHPWEMVFNTAEFAFGVPLAILVLGFALRWAFAGFRK